MRKFTGMEKGKSTADEFCAGDRLSELPDSLIFDIFRFLPMTDVVRTTILSKRWENLWTTVSYLNFEDDENVSTDKVVNFVNQVINSWRGVKIVRFKLDFICKHEKSISTSIDSWLRFATEKQVEELELYFPDRNDFPDVELYLVPQYIYSCSSLKILWLTSCDFQIHENVQWDQLESLTIDGEVFLSEDAVNKMMSGSPRLEVMSLTLCDSKENLCIRSTSLEGVKIEKCLFDKDYFPSLFTELKISAPNLATLEMKGVPYGKCSLEVSSLTTAWLMFDGRELYRPDESLWDGFVAETLSQIFPKIQHVGSVVLSNWCIKGIGAMLEEDMFYFFPNVGYLRLHVCSREYKQVLDVVEMFPSIRVLDLKTTYKSPPKHVENCSVKFEKSQPYLFPRQLEKVDVTWNKGDDSILPLLEVLFKYARNLKKMVIRERRNSWSRTQWKPLFVALQKLARVPRSSPTAELIFC